MRQRRRAASFVKLVSLSTIATAVAFVAWLFLAYPQTQSRLRGPRRELALVIGDDTTIEDVAGRLEREHFIPSAFVFRLYARLLGAERTLRHGTILVRDDMDVRTLVLRVADGFGPAFVPVTIPEGMDRYQIGDRLERWGITTRDEFVRATEDRALLDEKHVAGATAEGYLFPDTYVFPEQFDARRIVSVMVSTFWEEAEDVVRDAPVIDSAGPIPDVQALVTLASIVEEEAVEAEEQPVIAGVFLNRLRDEAFLPRHRLQADPTVSYGCKVEPGLASCRDFDGRRITRAMLDGSDNRYNTYRHAGLPPTPISNPGLGALRAAASPGAHRFFFFVARGGGRHAFSETLDRHNEGVSALRERERAAGAP